MVRTVTNKNEKVWAGMVSSGAIMFSAFSFFFCFYKPFFRYQIDNNCQLHGLFEWRKRYKSRPTPFYSLQPSSLQLDLRYHLRAAAKRPSLYVFPSFFFCSPDQITQVCYRECVCKVSKKWAWVTLLVE
jgi:hypothetical protein